MGNLLTMKKIEIRKLKSKLKKVQITVRALIHAPIDKVWKSWTTPSEIEKWNAASDDWYCPKAVNDLKPGGNFSFTMSARDGSFSFDFNGVYDEVATNKVIRYTIADGRKVKIQFKPKGKKTEVVEIFEAEHMHPHDMQRQGWQAILDNFKKLVE